MVFSLLLSIEYFSQLQNSYGGILTPNKPNVLMEWF
jgi:hypothetical protein